MSGRLQGKRALVTGSTSNIGRAIAEAFAAEGAQVIVSGRSDERGAAVVDGIRARGGRADFVRALPISSLYSSTKGAMETLTRAWAAEFGPRSVRVNAISPGVTLEPTPGDPHPGEVMMNGTPAGGTGKPRNIAHAAVYLASEEAAFVHGITLDVDGGRTTVAVIAA